MAASRRNLNPPAPLVALVGWVVPGFGYWLLGQRSRALTVCITIVLLFALGMLIGGVRVVDAPELIGTGSLGFVGRVLQKPWFIGQVLAGPISLASAWWAMQVPETLGSHARVAEIGTLYTAVAGMLNLLAIIDSAYRASREEHA